MVAKAVKDSSKKPTSQGKAFIEAARAAGCSEDEAVFDENINRIVKPKPIRSEKGAKPRK